MSLHIPALIEAAKPRPEPTGDYKVVEITRELTFKVRVYFEREQDDDGCDPPSISGNHMTGSRNSWSNEATAVVVDSKSLTEAACDAVNESDPDVIDGIND